MAGPGSNIPFSFRPLFVCKFGRQGSIASFLGLGSWLTVFGIPYFADTYTLQRQCRLYILGIARPQSQFPHSYVFERFFIPRISLHISSSKTGRPIVGIYNSLTDTWMWKLGLRPRYSFSGNICFKYSAFCLCSVLYCSCTAQHVIRERYIRRTVSLFS